MARPNLHRKVDRLEDALQEQREDIAPTSNQPLEWNPKPYEKDPVKFAVEILRFTPTEYQTKLLTDEKKRIVVIWPRQSGKTTTLSIRMIWYAATKSAIELPKGMAQHSYLVVGISSNNQYDFRSPWISNELSGLRVR